MFSLLLAAAAATVLAQSPGSSAATANTAAPPPTSEGRPVVLGRFVPFAERKPVSYETVKGYVLFKLTVAGQEGWALLDTGSQISAIDQAFAESKGLKAETTGTRVETYRGGSALRVVRDVPVVIQGQFETRAPALAVVDLKVIGDELGRKVDFVFGGDYLATALVLINPASATIQFAPSGTLNAPPNAPVIPLRNGKLQVEATIAGQPIVLALDTGSHVPVTLTPEAWARLGPSAGSLDGQSTTDKRGFVVKVADVPEIRIGPATLNNVKVLIQPALAGMNVDGVIGAPFFDGKLVAMDAKAGKLLVIARTVRPAAQQPAAQ